VKVRLLAMILAMLLLLTACGSETPAQTTTEPQSADHAHVDSDKNRICDICSVSVEVIIDFYAINDLHGKIADADTHPGVDELTTYLRYAQNTDDHAILLSSGDMWQGSAESNTTQGLIATDWMNDLGFVSMTLGNHEFDWGEDPVTANASAAQFPFLAINIYDRETKAQVSYCQSSLLVDCGQVQVGIIGAMGDCYSSIAPDKVEDVYFITGEELTELVKKESEKLRAEGADMIVYSIHDGYTGSTGASAKNVTGNDLDEYYDMKLSDGYVDLVFEGHTHQRYILKDSYGVYHLQNGGDNEGISHVEVSLNTLTGKIYVRQKELVSTGTYARMQDDPIVEQLLEKYAEELSESMRVLGTNATQRNGTWMRELVADLYYQVGVETWGDEYDIALGGGFISIRDPGYLSRGEVTYGMLQGLFPFDNELVLCSIKGRDLKERFFESDHYAYFISYGEYGARLKDNLDPDATYYVVVDTYSSSYGPNNLTEVARYTPEVYARDLLADYITAGGLN